MAYVKTNDPWLNDEAGGTEIDADAMNHIEQGIYDAHYNAVVAADAAAEVALTVRGAASQSGDLLRIEKSDTTPKLIAEFTAQDSLHLRVGRQDAWSEAPDLFWDGANHKLKARSILLADHGDSPDLALRRGGNDTLYNDPAPETGLADNVQIAPIYWQAWNGESWSAIANSRNATINCRTVGAQTPTNQGGKLQFLTQRQGAVGDQAVVRMEIDHNGGIILHGDANSGTRPRIFNGSGNLIIDIGRTTQLIGFLGANPVARQTVTGAKGGNAALASLLTALANLGLITDSTSA